jgi:hypothetical protein
MNALVVDEMTPLPPLTGPPALPEPARPLRFERSIDLAALPTALICTRLFVASTLQRWGARFLEADAEVLAVELVRHSVATCGVIDEDVRLSALEDVTVIRLRLLGFEQCIGIEVWDNGTKPARLSATDQTSKHGGLNLVDARAKAWGSYSAPGGRVVWAELAVYEQTGAGLPRRRAEQPPHPPPPASTEAPPPDLDVLRRVRAGLGEL